MKKSGVMVLLVAAIVLLLGTAASSHAAAPSNVLYSAPGAEGVLRAGNQLAYGDYTLRMQSDCNLVLYAKAKAIWSSKTPNKATKCYLTLQSDGKLVLYGYKWIFQWIFPWWTLDLAQVWSSKVASNTKGNYALVLKYDGTFHVYGPVIWSKPSSITKTGTDHSNLLSSPIVDSTFWTGDIAPIGTTIANGDYKLELLGNCNLTLSNGKTNEILWFTDTHDKYNLYDCFVSLEDNGEFVIKYIGGAPLWTSGAKGPAKSDYVLALRPDGNACVYGPSIWFAGAKDKAAGHAVAVGSHAEKIAMVTELL